MERNMKAEENKYSIPYIVWGAISVLAALYFLFNGWGNPSFLSLGIASVVLTVVLFLFGFGRIKTNWYAHIGILFYLIIPAIILIYFYLMTGSVDPSQSSMESEGFDIAMFWLVSVFVEMIGGAVLLIIGCFKGKK